MRVALLLIAQSLNKLLARNRLTIVVFVVGGNITETVDQNVRIGRDSSNSAHNVLGDSVDFLGQDLVVQQLVNISLLGSN